MIDEITYLGKVINVDSSAIEVEVSNEIPSAAPIINGRLYKLGQIGTFVKIPIGGLTLFGIVSSVSNTPSKSDTRFPAPNYGSRYVHVQLVGEQIGDKFQKGVGTYPTINDEVHIVTEEDLKNIYGDYQQGYFEIGKHSSSENLSVYLDLHNFVLRHSAVLGSTGSGKSNTITIILKQILKEYPGSRIVLVDIHGEYKAAFENDAKVFRIGDSVNPLVVPFWIMTFDELSFFLVGRQAGQEQIQDRRLREKIVEMKLSNASKLKAGKIDLNFVTADSPIPFDIRKMWHDFNREVNATHKIADRDKQTKDTEELVDEGDPAKLEPARFKPYVVGSAAPYQAKNQEMYSYEKKINARLKDSRFDFMFNPGDFYNADSKYDIDELLRNWIDHDKRLTILDLNEIPFELIDISVGLITRLIFDSMYWGRYEDYTGRSRPLLMVYEEAHSYLPKSETSSFIYGYARKAVERIYKEGRKFGIGAMVISQRPSELSETILAQVGTFITLRLTNSGDKGNVQSSLPNNMISLIELLSTLRIGEAIIVGESIQIPSRVRIELAEPKPSSNDPNLVEGWKKKYTPKKEFYKKVVNALRVQQHIKYGKGK
jgi:uncharacterized protein